MRPPTVSNGGGYGIANPIHGKLRGLTSEKDGAQVLLFFMWDVFQDEVFKYLLDVLVASGGSPCYVIGIL